MKKHTLEEIKAKFPDYKDYIEILKRIKFETRYDRYITVEDENKFFVKYINSDVEEVLRSKFIGTYLKKHNTNCISGSTLHELEEEMEEYLRKLPDFLNFLIKQL